MNYVTGQNYSTEKEELKFGRIWRGIVGQNLLLKEKLMSISGLSCEWRLSMMTSAKSRD